MRLTTNTLWRLCLLTFVCARPHPLSLPVATPTDLHDERDLSINTSTSSWPVGPSPDLLARARGGQKPKPLLTPQDESIKGRGRATRHLNFMEKILTEEPGGPLVDIPIVPIREQLETWKINGIPIGVTSFFYPWDKNKKMTFKMRGLTGCTATLILSEEGMWAAHHWESVKETSPGGSSFWTRIPPPDGKLIETPLDVFQTIAVDILDGLAPPGVIRTFESFDDLKETHNDPFGFPGNADIFVLTKAWGPQDMKPRYDKHIKLLEKGYKDRLSAAQYFQETYVGDLTTTPVDPIVAGKVVVQYTPYERDDPRDDCGKIAKAVVWAENKTRPIIEKEWETE
ncbi:hypothetical protein V8F20_009026 [Naviculisporaceae sp. PSN 640]